LGKVEDVVLNLARGEVVALLVSEGRFVGERAIPSEAVRTIGEDVVLVETEEALLAPEELPGLAEGVRGREGLKRWDLVTTDGQVIGRIEDVVVGGEDLQRIAGYRLSRGWWEDAKEGYAFVPHLEEMTLGEEVILAPPHIEHYVQRELGGLRRVLTALQTYGTEAWHKISEATRRVAEEETLANFGEVLALTKDWAEELGHKANQKLVEQAMRYVVGKRSGQTIADEKGELIVGEGEIVTAEEAQRARQAGRLAQLVAAVGKQWVSEQFAAARERVSEVCEATRKKAPEVVEPKPEETETPPAEEPTAEAAAETPPAEGEIRPDEVSPPEPRASVPPLAEPPPEEMPTEEEVPPVVSAEENQ